MISDQVFWFFLHSDPIDCDQCVIGYKLLSSKPSKFAKKYAPAGSWGGNSRHTVLLCFAGFVVGSTLLCCSHQSKEYYSRGHY